MAEQFSQLKETHKQFIAQQHMYFVGTAGAEGMVNLAPKGIV